MIKTETALILDTDDEWRLRQLLDSLTDFSNRLLKYSPASEPVQRL